MPRRSFKKRNFRKRTYNTRKRRASRVRRARGRRMRRYSTISAMPKTKMMKFRYVEQISLDATATVSDIYQFRANDLYDPNYTGTGHQPLLFDQFVGVFYDHFTVLGSKMKIKVQSTTDDNTSNGIVGIHVNDSNTWITSRTEQLENPRTVYTPIGSNKAGTGEKYLSMNFSTRKFFGKSRTAVLGDDQLKGSVGSAPAEQAYYQIFYMGSDPAALTNPSKIYLTVTIDYVALLTEPKAIAGS